MNFSAINSIACGRVQAIALGEPMLKCSARPYLNRSSWLVGSTKVSGTRPMQALGSIPNLLSRLFHTHKRVKIRQTIGCPRGPDRRQVRRIQTKEIHALFPIQRDVRPDIEFGKAREPGNRGKKSRTNPAHAKGNDANPGISFELIQWELRRDERTELLNRNGPVRKKQIVPDLLHNPWRIGRRISPMGRRL